MLIETTEFRLAASADEAAFLAADRDVQADHNAHRGGFIRRTTARGEDGTWIVVTIWDSAAAADADAGRDADAAFVSVIDGDSVRRRRWTTLD